MYDSLLKNANESKYIKFFLLLFNDCQPKTVVFRVSTSNLGHPHGKHLEA